MQLEKLEICGRRARVGKLGLAESKVYLKGGSRFLGFKF
jgi:hypothetical protein